MIRSILKFKVVFLFFLICACKGGMLYDHSCRHLVLKFQYDNYIGKTFGNFYRDFKEKGDKKNVEMRCGLYYPKAGLVGGTELQVGHGYKVSVLTNNSGYYVPDFSDTIPKCFECSCIQNDTAKIKGFIISQNNRLLKTVNN